MTAVRFRDGQTVDVIDADCEFRPCFTFGHDKGPYAVGRGYTRPETPWRPVCNTRHLGGCPHVGVHLKCGDCQEILALVMGDEERVKPDVCPECGSDDLYWLADVLPEPKPCCDNPQVPKPRNGSKPYKQRCKSCGQILSGKRLQIARAAAWNEKDASRRDEVVQ
jgi:hypothetical protein